MDMLSCGVVDLWSCIFVELYKYGVVELWSC